MKVSGSRQLPMRHISIRVPWNDTGWQGCVCQRPSDKISCLILPRIRETKDDQLEEKLAGFSWKDLEQDQLPVCATERGSFMAPYDFSRAINHPYAEKSSAHSQFQAAGYRYPAYSAGGGLFNVKVVDFS